MASATAAEYDAAPAAPAPAGADDESFSVLDLDEQTNRPADVAINQQRVNAWHPILDPGWVIAALFIVGVICIPTGFKIAQLSRDVVEVELMYDDGGADSETDTRPNMCGINSTYNANRTCVLTATLPADMKPPILVYYQLTNFHQNYRKYQQSRDDWQLSGIVGNQNKFAETNCAPLNHLGNQTLNPCGLIANTFFNDYYTLEDTGVVDANGQPLDMIETGIAWSSDLKYAFAQPNGFRSQTCAEAGFPCDATCCEGEEWSCTEPWADNKTMIKTNASAPTCYRYYYPDDDTTHYLYETYPDIISPIEGVTNEHFVVWMRVATYPKFRKLYGWFDTPLPAGTTLQFRVNANYAVERFKGTKTLIITTNNIFGGRNPVLGAMFWIVGCVFLAAAVFFFSKQTLRPRKLADPSYLHQKQD